MCILNNGVVEKWWQEPERIMMDPDDDPYEETNSRKLCRISKECLKLTIGTH